MPSSSSSSNKPILSATVPLHATNGWVINRARELIEYDKYGAITKWIDEASDEASDEENGKKPSTATAFNYTVEANPNSSAVGVLKGHPAGELEDYDPDCRILSQKTMVEALEAMAAKTDAFYSDDDDDDDDSDDEVSFFTSPERIDDNVPSASSLSYYQSIVNGSLSSEPLLNEYKQPNFTVDVEAEAVADSVEDAADLVLGRISPPYAFPPPTPLPLSLGTRVMLGIEIGASSSRVADEDQMSVGTSQTVVRHSVPEPAPKPSKLSKLSTLFRTPSSSFLTVPRPIHTRVQTQKGKLGRKEKDISTYGYPFTYEHPSVYPEIERGASPIPRMRPVHSHTRRTSASSSLLSRVLSRGNSSSSHQTRKSNSSSCASQAPSTSASTPTLARLSSSASSSRRGKTPASPEREREILSPVPRRVGRLFSRLQVSPFRRGQAGIESPGERAKGGVYVEGHGGRKEI
ncbi:hypothetical protein GGR51DRAFT_557999 [Nemania sp. FL0031]|nr:hypothetical protein GGR51DRAFT_557999 [Nemania sp. FL0031]